MCPLMGLLLCNQIIVHVQPPVHAMIWPPVGMENLIVACCQKVRRTAAQCQRSRSFNRWRTNFTQNPRGSRLEGKSLTSKLTLIAVLLGARELLSNADIHFFLCVCVCIFFVF